MDRPVGEFEQETRSGSHTRVRNRGIDALLKCFATSVGADTAILVAREQNPGTHVLATWTREGREPTVAWTPDSLVGRAFEREGALIESSSNGDARRHRAVATAVRSHERVLGAIYAGFEPPSGQTHEELIWAAETYAGLAALCMSGDDLTLSAALGAAGFDPLTGCLSYGAVIEVLRSEVQRSQRRGHMLSACMIDLDGFKRVNDQRGHVEGNRVLRAAGTALRSAARRYDAVGRFGGDEFMVVLPETGGRDGQRVAERFLVSVRSAMAAATTVSLDASVGIVEWNGEASPVELLEMADRAMRAAKAAGGARVQSQPRPGGRFDGIDALSQRLAGPLRAASDDEPPGLGG